MLRLARKAMTDYSKWSKDRLVKRLQQLEGASSQQPQTRPSATKTKDIDFSKFTTRKIALRFGYLGWGYNGLAIQPNGPSDIKTVEFEILKACHKTRLVPDINTQTCEFSRCGRTDRGVSALRQVISLRVRSMLTLEQQQQPENDHKELDYLHILNSLLPSDIRIYEICLRPGEDFDARFSCTSRHYKYFFTNDGLDIEKMDEAARLFIGEHDFRNYCKVDASKQITNFRRAIMESSIIHHSHDLYYFDLKGSAFLWHQVRSMIAILLLVGQGLEDVSIVSKLLDMDYMPTRPVYEMAADYPLVLYDCEFPPMEWTSFRNPETMQRTKYDAYNLWHEQYLKASMAQELLTMMDQSASSQTPPRLATPKQFINTGNGKGRSTNKYVPLETRERLDPPEVVNQRFLDKKQAKEDQESNDQ